MDPTHEDFAADDQPVAPPLVYKYVVADRIDVLRNAEIRFTPPLNTNDLFEVRQTFDLLAGPKMHALFNETAVQIDTDQTMREVLEEMGLGAIPADAMKAHLSQFMGGDVDDLLRAALGNVVNDALLPMMNSVENIDTMLERLGRNLICLSLTERPDSSPMWAHYGGNSTGFVIAFDSQSAFFRRGDEGERQGLQKITYFDGRIGEPMDDPYRAFISKQADWSYEREWRLYLKADQATRSFTVGDDEIHLVQFPREAVRRVVLGLRASQELEAELAVLLDQEYPEVPLTRVCADRSTATLSEQAVAAG